jgi:DNA-binding transcriptional regulator YdaS (Cro superfamily)
MTFRQLCKHFGGQVGLAEALGITRQAVHKWNGVVPWGQAAKIQEITKGEITIADLPTPKLPKTPKKKVTAA